MKKLLTSVHICQSYHKNNSATLLCLTVHKFVTDEGKASTDKRRRKQRHNYNQVKSSKRVVSSKGVVSNQAQIRKSYFKSRTMSHIRVSNKLYETHIFVIWHNSQHLLQLLIPTLNKEKNPKKQRSGM